MVHVPVSQRLSSGIFQSSGFRGTKGSLETVAVFIVNPATPVPTPLNNDSLPQTPPFLVPPFSQHLFTVHLL